MGFSSLCRQFPKEKVVLLKGRPHPDSEIQRVLNICRRNPSKKYFFSKIFCGNRGRSVKEIAPLCIDALWLDNVYLPEEFIDEIARRAVMDDDWRMAQQILQKQNHPNSLGPDEDAIVEAEKYAFFNGGIRFLFHNENNVIDWSHFNDKFENAKKIFDISGLKYEYRKNAKANRIILSYCDNWSKQIYSFTRNDKFIFGYTSSLWLNNILLKVDNYAYPIHKLLMDEDINPQPKLLGGDDKQSLAFNRLVKSNIISLLQEYNYRDNYYIRWKYDGYSIYPNSEGVILTHDVRDSILNKLQNEGLIDSISQTYLDSPKQRFYHGWNIRFKYKDYVFAWMYTNKIEMFDGETNLSEIVGMNLHTDLDTSSSHTGNTFNDATSLITELDRCINQYENGGNNNTRSKL